MRSRGPTLAKPLPLATSSSSSGAGRQRAPCVCTQPLHGRDHARQSRLLAPEHRSPLVGRKAVAVHVHHIDVTGAQRDALGEDAGTLVDQRVQQPLGDLGIVYDTAADAEFARHLLDERGDFGVGHAVAALVAVEAAAALLPEAPGGHQALQDRRPALVGGELASLADLPADVVAGQIPHRQRAHGETERLDDAVDLLGRCALLQEELRFRAVEHEHAVADEAVAVAGEHRDLAERLAERHDGSERLPGSGAAAHVLQQLHDVRRTEEVRADHLLRPPRRLRDGVDVERRGVGRQNGMRRAHLVQPREDLLLDAQVLEHRLDDDVRLRERRVVGDAADERLRLLGARRA